jgi:biotin-(acetyl-CoA carboxylase) ligase
MTGAADNQEKIDGFLEGLGENGQLLLRVRESGEIRELYSGELSVSAGR